MVEKADLDKTAVSRYKKGPKGGTPFRIGPTVARRVDYGFDKEKGWLDQIHTDSSFEGDSRTLYQKSEVDESSMYPLLTSEQINDFVWTDKKPTGVDYLRECREGMTSLRGFAVLEETSQFEPTITLGSVYHIIPTKKNIENLKDCHFMSDKLSAFFVDDTFVIGRLELKPLKEKYLRIPEIGSKDISKHTVKYIGPVIQIDLPFNPI